MAGLLSMLGLERVRFTLYNPAAPQVPVLTFTVDASIDELHQSTAQITSHPVVSGIPLTDNARVDAVPFKMTALFTDTGVRLDESIRKLASVDDHKSIYETFRDAQRGAFLFTINTSLVKYERMMLRSISAPRNSLRGNCLEATLDFIEVRTAKSTKLGPTSTKANKTPAAKTNAAPKAVGPKPQPPAPAATVKGSALGLKTLEAVKKTANVVKGLK